MKAARVLPAVALALAVGVLGGALARRVAQRPALPAGRTRPPALRRALDAYERGAGAEVATHLEQLPPGAAAEDRAEAALLRALATGDLRALYAVLDAYEGSRAAARARWEILARTPDGPRRRAMRADFVRRHPGAWVLGRGEEP